MYCFSLVFRIEVVVSFCVKGHFVWFRVRQNTGGRKEAFEIRMNTTRDDTESGVEKG